MRCITIALVCSGCIFGGEDEPPVISNLQCTPEMLMRTTPPYPIKCTLDVANDGGDVSVTAFGGDGLDVPITGLVRTGDVGRVSVDFKLAADPFIGSLTLLVSVTADSGKMSNELTAQILVQ
jgi:hypothetical protein